MERRLSSPTCSSTSWIQSPPTTPQRSRGAEGCEANCLVGRPRRFNTFASAARPQLAERLRSSDGHIAWNDCRGRRAEDRIQALALLPTTATLRGGPDGVRRLDGIHSKSPVRPQSGTSGPLLGAKRPAGRLPANGAF